MNPTQYSRQNPERNRPHVEAISRRADVIDFAVRLMRAAVPEEVPASIAIEAAPVATTPTQNVIPLRPDVVAPLDAQQLNAEEARRQLEAYWSKGNDLAA